MIFIVYLISINIISFILCFLDKIKSIKGWYRISERVLLVLSLLGGCFGMFVGMKLFRHKTKKLSFTIGFPTILIAEICLVIYLAIGGRREI